jgi:uncharacterized ion transporter superfamily protein YfcC
MAETKTSGIRISRKAFIQAVLVIFVLMILSGVLTKLVPAGQYARLIENGREVIDATSFSYKERPNYPIWRWLTAPVEVLFAEGNTTVIAIILFILLVGVAFAVMDRSGILKLAVGAIIRAAGGRKVTLLLVITFCFMALGGFFGIFEEIIPLVPIMIALAYSLGWDSLTGMGMSVLATNVGFSMAVFNPFTIGVSHRLAGLPMFSGAGLRLVWFFIGYAILAMFLVWHIRRIEQRPEASLVYIEDQSERQRLGAFTFDEERLQDPRFRRAGFFLAVFFILILAVLVASPFVPLIGELALPLTGLLFIIGGIGSALIAGTGRGAWKAAWEGFLGISPAVPLLLMAASVKHIVASGEILDTILHWASTIFTGTSPLTAALLIYGLTLILELFISSGSAKALLVIPILMPLADLVGVTRQIAVSAYCFGDGFSNLAYPTNAALLITLSLTVVPYAKWLRWLLKLWFWIILATVAFLVVAVAIHYGPF